ncbi:glycosyltransferase family 25 protein [Morganella morganii]|uniref:glycosyltransferase family 25 protein n=1 Tax=Morganella morganii TaxID=582 RepID=UPI003B2781B6
MVKVYWRFVDKVVYINLAKRTDRRESIEFQLKKVGVPPEKIIRFEAIENENGTLGCTLSHISVMEMAEKNNWENVLVLEDDMIFNDDDDSLDRINYFFSSLMSTTWDAGLLSGGYYSLKLLHGCFYQLYFSFLSNSYIVNQHYYKVLKNIFSSSKESLVNGVDRKYCSLDYCWIQLMKKDNWYAIYPCVGYQKTDMSDIENKETNREHLFFRKLDEMKK